MKAKRIIFFIVVLVCELALVFLGGKFEVVFIKMFLLFFGLMFVYSGLTKDPWFWSDRKTKMLVYFWGEKGTQAFELIGGVGIIVLVVFMALRL